jgi:hypothetical protein
MVTRGRGLATVFQGQGSKVKVIAQYAKLVDRMETKIIELAISNLVHILLLLKGGHLSFFKVRGLSSRSCYHFVEKYYRQNIHQAIGVNPTKICFSSFKIDGRITLH